MFKVSPASLQTFFEPPKCVLEYRVQYRTYTFRMHSVMAIFKSSIVWRDYSNTIFCVILYCNHQVGRDFFITLYLHILFTPQRTQCDSIRKIVGLFTLTIERTVKLQCAKIHCFSFKLAVHIVTCVLEG
jgi:hypothetical protein